VRETAWGGKVDGEQSTTIRVRVTGGLDRLPRQCWKETLLFLTEE
jgi:hypothetical protein